MNTACLLRVICNREASGSNVIRPPQFIPGNAADVESRRLVRSTYVYHAAGMYTGLNQKK